ncbi:MAG: radical SAM protein [Negativicutes bacterium]|nr:radical SAM protein [Negativicutes bacterium]
MYYRLRNSCKLVEGANRGAIYDLETGKVTSINRGALQLLLACQQNSLEDVLEIDSPDDKAFIDFLHQLIDMGLGSFYLNCPEDKSLPDSSDEQAKLNFLWLELTSCCNNRCLHCYATSGPCVEPDSVPHERWLSLITEARAAGATAIQLIGGEPLLYSGWRELVERAKQEGYEYIEIFTNATLIDDACIAFFKEAGVHIATTIYADNAAAHDMVTANPGSFQNTMASIEKILAAGIPLRVASIIMKANEHEVQNIMDLCEKLGLGATPPDVVRPTGRGDDRKLLPTAYAKKPITPPFFTDPTSFYRAQRYHSCLAGKIAVTAGGDVIPCIFARNQICGNILNSPLQDVLNGALLQQCWQTTKDQVEKCKDCEYRYACGDCRPLAQGSDSEKRWLSSSVDCQYNPYTGIWKDDHTCPMMANSNGPNGKPPK